MSALDTFEWYVTTQLAGTSPEVGKFIRVQREYLFTLRSEDERQRFVDAVIVELHRMGRAEQQARPSPGAASRRNA
ncbi:MAG TPA: hypothetical protein VI932_03220 [Bacteroidota bacterium]|nr:hypothetical protein [Bacteroidota bacterium]